GVAAIVSAGVAVIADDGRPDAGAGRAVIAGRAGIAVRAGVGVVVDVDAHPGAGVAAIVGAGVAVIADDGRPDAGPGRAVIRRRAGVTVGAGVGVVVDVDAQPRPRVARIVRARVAVIADDRRSHARARRAMVGRRAGVAV